MTENFISSEGDLEVVVLLETHRLLADIIGPEYYDIGGTAPDQSAHFKNDIAFDAFLVRTNELLSPPTTPVPIAGKNVSVSLLGGLERICTNHPKETALCGLGVGAQSLRTWLNATDRTRIWCPEAGIHVQLEVSHEQLIFITANAMKHQLLRLSRQLEKVRGWCVSAGYAFSPSTLVAVHNDLILNTRPALQYYGTVILELLGKLFFGLNRLVLGRLAANPTNDVSKMRMPAGVSSDVIKNLYGELLCFHSYTDERIAKFTPTAGWFVRNSYWRWIDV